MSRRKEIFKDASIYTISSYIAQVFDVLNGILVRRFLGPTNMGIWTFLQVVQNYAKHAGLGVTTATSRDVPYYLGKGDTQKAQQTQNLVFTFTVMTAFAAALCVAGFALIKHREFQQPILIGLFVVAGLILLQRVYNLFVVVVRSHKAFEFAGLLNIASSITSLILTVTLTWRFQLYGFFIATMVNYVLMTALIMAKTPYRFSFYWNWKELRPLLTFGMVMVVSDIMRSVLLSIDRIMIAKYLGFEALGHYSIALMTGNYLYSLPNMLGIIFFPHLQEAFAKRDNHQDLEKYLREPTLVVAYLFPFLIGGIWIVSAWLFPVILPQYDEGIPALKYYILGSFFLALTHPFINFVITVKKHWNLLPLQAFFIAIGFGSAWLLIKMGWGLSGVAIAGVLLAVSEFLILSMVALKQMYNLKTMLALYAKVFGVFAYFAALLFILDAQFWPQSTSLLRYIAEFGVFAILLSPCLFFAEKEARVLSTGWGILREFFMKRKTAA